MRGTLVYPLILFLSAPCAAQESNSKLPKHVFFLEEVEFSTVPQTTQIDGIVASDFRLAAWGRDFILTTNPERHTSILGIDVVGIGLFENSLELVDATARSLVTIALDGKRLNSIPLEMPLMIIAAVRGPRFWYIVGSNARADYEVYRFDPLVKRSTPVALVDTMPQMALHLSVCGNGFIVSTGRLPFKSVQYDSVGKVLRTIAPSIPPETGPLLAGPLLPLDRGFIQSFSNPQSDTRVFTLFDLTGHQIRMTATDLPVGFAASDLESRTIVAFRRHTRTDIVRYRWRWEAAFNEEDGPCENL